MRNKILVSIFVMGMALFSQTALAACQQKNNVSVCAVRVGNVLVGSMRGWNISGAALRVWKCQPDKTTGCTKQKESHFFLSAWKTEFIRFQPLAKGSCYYVSGYKESGAKLLARTINDMTCIR